MSVAGGKPRLGELGLVFATLIPSKMQSVPVPEEYDESGTKGMSSTSGDTKVGSVLNGRSVNCLLTSLFQIRVHISL
jgi:hypothetical protein